MENIIVGGGRAGKELAAQLPGSRIIEIDASKRDELSELAGVQVIIGDGKPAMEMGVPLKIFQKKEIDSSKVEVYGVELAELRKFIDAQVFQYQLHQSRA